MSAWYKAIQMIWQWIFSFVIFVQNLIESGLIGDQTQLFFSIMLHIIHQQQLWDFWISYRFLFVSQVPILMQQLHVNYFLQLSRVEISILEMFLQEKANSNRLQNLLLIDCKKYQCSTVFSTGITVFNICTGICFLKDNEIFNSNIKSEY